ncbi:hypothetical protein N7492_002472 [Penicillium capsulatum]|uniref:histidine kinase n=1 Tax=Penicillium capsulatum TaxID=69766 RepID=A0A9W9IK62_9EURO|nr:hypothetical protein N7492_002472 [Penicillium capsulatum]
MCNKAVSLFTQEGRNIFVVPDLTQDERFRFHSSVTGPPHHRFYASVPVISPEGYVIGSVAVMDDKPRESGLNEEEIEVLQELSATVMDHLLSQRAMREEYREEKMVRALGLFVQGKSDLKDGIYGRDWNNGESSEQLPNVNERLERLQISSERSGSKSRSPQTPKDNPISPEHQGSQERGSRSPVRKFKLVDSDETQTESEKEENQLRPSMSPTTSQIQKSIAPSTVQSVLNRASCLMAQALDIEGAMFIDSSVYSRRRMIGANDGQRDHQNEFTVGDDSDEAYGTQGYFNIPPFQDHNEPKTLVLGYSTSSGSSRDDDQRESHYVSLPGAFVSHLIDRYPRGKIFHIDADGSIALSFEGLADDVSQAYIAGDRSVEALSPKEKDLQQETRDIMHFREVLPDARCIAIYPVWDFHRSRWFTVSVTWTNDPGRVLSEPKDLTYVAAFSNSVMAEVSRFDLEAADRAKGDFISSISHELRSPLHGVLGTVELLQETAISYSQRGLIETVYSCGRTLLDTLNHLLDYAKINTLTAARPPPGNEKEGNLGQPKMAVPGMVQNEDISDLVQEVVEGLLAGAEFYNRETDATVASSTNGSEKWSTSSTTSANKLHMMNIVDIEWQDDWHCSIYAGAWRRVVMNLFGNALKYTKSGYIRLLMKKDVIEKGSDRIPAVRIVISDSGRGMSQDFLLHHLYIPFLQEDTQSPGLGVGLHLVHQIVKSLDGRIHFRSQLDHGTDVDVLLPVANPDQMNLSPSPYHSLREHLRGKSVSFFTQSLQRGDLGIRPEAFEDMLQSMRRMVSEWFGLRVLSHEECQQHPADFLVVTEHEYRTLAHEPEDSDIRMSIESSTPYPLIVLSAQASSWKVAKESKEDQAIFLSQP